MRKKRSRELLTPDITPLIDVVFLLLIFFMVSTVFKKNELALMLKLPEAEKGIKNDQALPNNLYIEMNKTKIAINGKELSFDNIDSFFKTIKNKIIPVEIRIDKKVEYARVIKLLDKLKQYELNNLALITE